MEVDPMSLDTRIESLNKKHEELEVKLHDAYVHHLSEEKIRTLKMEKLKIKDEILHLKQAA